MNRRIDPLSQEERELAERLGRLGGPREPAPALDAAILAAARAAVAEDETPPAGLAAASLPTADAPVDATLDPAPTPTVTPFRPRRTVPRWPLGLSIAASLVLAAGIGWKLQGDGDGSSAEASKAMSASAPAAAEDAVILDPALDRAPVQAPPPPPPLEEDAARRVAAEAPAPQQALAKAAARKDDAFADSAVADALQAPAAPSSAPPAAAPVAAASERDAEISVNREPKGFLDVSGGQVPRTPIGDGRDADVGAAEYTRTPLEQRREQAKSASRAADAAAAPPPPPPAPSMTVPERARQAGQGLAGNAAAADKPVGAAAESTERYDDRPPVSADSPAFRQAWLQRIRTLLARGDTVAAGNSLQEFRRRYPGAELPEDLRKFAATLPPPAP
ncbi:MAG: hypothetical protein ACTHOH_11280 [Lysobacteraceae bacterium]